MRFNLKALSAIVLFLLSAASALVLAQAGFKPGDRVEVDKARTGIWEKGTVVEYLRGDNPADGYLRVRLDAYPLSPEGYKIPASSVRPYGSTAAKPLDNPQPKAPVPRVAVPNTPAPSVPASRPPSPSQPVPNQAPRQAPAGAGGSPRSLPGSAWKIDFGRGVTGMVFLFCRSARWEIVPARMGSVGVIGKSYSLSGNELTTVSLDDGKVQKWKVAWRDEILELDDGQVVMKLHYNGETQCK